MPISLNVNLPHKVVLRGLRSHDSTMPIFRFRLALLAQLEVIPLYCIAPFVSPVQFTLGHRDLPRSRAATYADQISLRKTDVVSVPRYAGCRLTSIPHSAYRKWLYISPFLAAIRRTLVGCRHTTSWYTIPLSSAAEPLMLLSRKSA